MCVCVRVYDFFASSCTGSTTVVQVFWFVLVEKRRKAKMKDCKKRGQKTVKNEEEISAKNPHNSKCYLL